MKIYISIIILLFTVSWSAKAQTFSDDNYVYTAKPKKKVQVANYNTLTKADITQSVTYFDGLGRPVQTTAINQGDTDGVTTTNMDIITPIEYDSFGRQVKEYLPYPLTNTTTSYSRIATVSSITALNGVYNTAKYENTTNPFSEKRFEPSPLNRILEQAAPGNDWAINNAKKNTIKLEYQTNVASDAVRLFKVTTGWNLGNLSYDITFSDAGSYAEYELYKTVTFDENSGVNPSESAGSTIEFKNKDGQVILKRTYDATVRHDTYYVYDIYGNLTYVIPPLAAGTISDDILKGLCYQYKYDANNRLAAKKLPGKQWEFIVYDKLDRPVATGPAFSPWGDGTAGVLITEYDIFGRVTQTGWRALSVSESTRGTWQANINGGTNPFVLATNDILTKNYYDSYGFSGAQTPTTTIEGQTVLTNVKSLSTGSWVRTLTTAAATLGETNTIFYDEYARPIQTYSVNYLTGYTITNTNLDFAGKTIYTITKHKRTSGSNEIVVREDFTYTAQDRLWTHTHKIASLATAELMAANKYDNLGQLMSKNVGNTAASPLQKVDFNYNIRGWLTEINKTANLQQGTEAKDLFAFKISYNTPQAAIAGAIALYNGNISETLWKTGSDNIDRGYGYSYDKLNRLKNSIYEKSGLTTNAYNENLTYDKNGNIVSLVRKGDIDPQAGIIEIDNLVYTPVTNSNQLAKVVDNTNNTSGFNDFNKVGDDYTYDANGNMITDKNKNITAITYNQLNLPRKITFGTTGNIEYFYNAAGQKVQKIVTETGKTAIVTDYLGGFQYKDNTLEFFPTAEGYVKNTLNVLSYVFQYKDHLGNVRVSYAKNPTTLALEIIEENNYYPFGLKHKGYNDYVPNTNKYKYNGKELQDELGLNFYDYGARNYDPALGRWMNIDPLAEKSRRFNPYTYALDNPVYFIDPDGMEAKSTGVNLNKDGTYTVVSGKADGDNNIYIADSKGNYDKKSETIGQSVSDSSFLDDKGKAVKGAIIDTKSTEAKDFINNEIIKDNPSTLDYMPNATGGKKYDLKEKGMAEAKKEGKTELQHRYRGSMSVGGKIASARDAGNIGAGIVAGRNGHSWTFSRLAFDSLESYQKSSITTEGATTQKAQKVGWEIGNDLWHKYNED